MENSMNEKVVTAESITLRTKTGQWLGQIVLTSDGAFMSITDYGNINFAWRAYGDDFKKFLLSLNADYFEGKMIHDFAYMGLIHNKTVKQHVKRFTEMILPALQEHLRKEQDSNNKQPILGDLYPTY